jgi:hypothetical protein
MPRTCGCRVCHISGGCTVCRVPLDVHYVTYLWMYSMPHFRWMYRMPRTCGCRVCHILVGCTVRHVPLYVQYVTYLWTYSMPHFTVDVQYATYLWMYSMPYLTVDGSTSRVSGSTLCHIQRWMYSMPRTTGYTVLVCHIYLWIAVCDVSLDATFVTGTTVLHCLYATVHPIL